jgi:hypothetical protein
MKKPFISMITDSVNVRVINLNVLISFSAVKELSVNYLFLEKISAGLKFRNVYSTTFVRKD